MQKNYEIQNIRAISMILILIGHMPIVLPGILMHGYTFVSLFLTISGYFAAVQFKKKYDSKDVKAVEVVRNEVLNKFFRLVPLMWIWILIYFIVGNIVIYCGGQYGDMDRWCKELVSALLGYYNYYLAGLDIGGLFGQYWTLFVEIHFYILFIICFLLVKKERQRRGLTIFIVLLTIFVLRPLTPTKLIRYVSHTQLDSLFTGVLIGLSCEDKKYLEQFKINDVIKRAISSFCCILLFFSGFFFDSIYNNANVKYTFYTIISAIILFLARENDGWFWSSKKIVNKFLGWAGDASASTYVSHVIIYSCLYYNLYYNTEFIPKFIKETSWGQCVQVVILIFVACIVGRISYVLIEKPYGMLSRSIIEKLCSKNINK